MKKVLKAVWEFCEYLFWDRGGEDRHIIMHLGVCLKVCNRVLLWDWYI